MALSRGCPAKLRGDWKARVLLAHDLNRAAWLLQFAPQRAEATRLRFVLRKLINQLWPEGAAGSYRDS